MEGPSGYVVCIQPKLTQLDYASAKRFQRSMQRLMNKVQRKLQDHENEQVKLVVFPEMIGGWLVAMGSMKQPKNGRMEDCLNDATSTGAMLSFVYNNPGLFFSNFIYSLMFGSFSVMHSLKKHSKIDPNTGRKLLPCWKEDKKSKPIVQQPGIIDLLLAHAQRTIFQLRAKAVFDTYVQTFSQLARNHNAYIVAGSAFLPQLDWKRERTEKRNGFHALKEMNGINGYHTDMTRTWFEFDSLIDSGEGYDHKELELTNDGLYNVSLSFNPQGEVCNVSYKTWLIKEEQLFLDSMPASRLTTFDCPLGRVAVPICADSWFPPTYDRLSLLGAEIICVPSFVTPASNWEQTWKGYSGFPEPDDVDKGDIGTKKENLMWEKYALKGRLKSTTSGAIGVSCFFVGKMWEMDVTGQSLIIDRQQEKTLRAATGHRDIVLHRVYLKLT